ncbi:MAG: hypothetical protein BWY09_01384 [Candidatus Hydrogenedentes bacterium ADurb.Bin179]|nr:MAG: hypothetical protein BWY09_01384 [Candidatus Hydrogenedentes bacterium ADurb.Bin179]
MIVEPGIGLVNIIGEGSQAAPGEIVLSCAHHHVGPLPAVQVVGRLTVVHLAQVSAGILRNAVPAQDMPSCPPHQHGFQQGLQRFRSLLHQFKIVLQIGRVHGQHGDIVRVEQLDLIVHVPGALVSGCGGQQAQLTPPFEQEVLEGGILLRGVVPEMMAFVNEHEIIVLVLFACQHVAAAPEHAHGNHPRAQIKLVAEFLPGLF